MSKYVDWINLMTYDLHGVWDADNPIGSIVQGHTNLTEIKSAAELFWRVNIPASKICMGIGFYGRSFTLSNSGCTTPGCGFKGASNDGPCSAAGGILAYYEIQSVLQKNTAIKPTWDKAAAVKYFTFSNDQWISYDDADTFKQKIDWANSVGLSGMLIWASDLGRFVNHAQVTSTNQRFVDDDKYSAHAALVGRSVYNNKVLQATKKTLSAPQAVIQDIAGSNGQNCFAYSGKCVNLDDHTAMAAACGRGFTVVGWDDAGCGGTRCVSSILPVYRCC
jgi:chitinase